MPFELGIFLGAKRFGSDRQRDKSCLILDQDSFRYVRFCSDLAGHDIRAHDNRTEGVIRSVRDWLSNQLVGRGVQIPSPSRTVDRYRRFRAQLPVMCSQLGLVPTELTFSEHRNLAVIWLRLNPR
jgi:hypothetical protein